MEDKQILVVDDDPDLLFLIAHGIKSLSPGYRVGTASSAIAALEQIKKQQFDLIVTDYMMPEMSGLELVSEVRQTLPKTRFVVMTAHHDSSHIRNLVGTMKIDGFVAKPFILPELLNIIQQAIMQSDTSDPVPGSTHIASQDKVILEKLNTLRQQTGAFTILLATANGDPLHVVGERNTAKISRLAAFMSSNFLAIAELATLFGDSNALFKSSYYEGNNYNVYGYNLGGEYFLAVIFGTDVKPGSVWFYTKQTVTTIAQLLQSSNADRGKNNNASLLNDFDNLLGDQANGNCH